MKSIGDFLNVETWHAVSLQIENAEIFCYYLKKLFAFFLYHDPAFDTIPIWLYDNYYTKIDSENSIFSESENRIIKKVVERKRRLMPGHSIPPLSAYNIDNHLISTDKIDKKYIIIWLWDHDCDLCIEETPKLNQFYKSFHDLFQFEIFAVSVTDDSDRWRDFSEKHDLQWINLSYAMGESNYEFVDYFDILTTPAIYLINKSHIIIERQFSLDDLYSIFESLNIDN
jgi:peroxiredoxin